MSSVTISAPGKLMLLGEHAVVYGQPCLVTAVNQRMSVTMELIDEPMLKLDAEDVGVRNYEKPIAKIGTGEIPRGARFVETAVKNFIDLHPMPGHGVCVVTHSQFKSTFGFGSSSASSVCVVAGLDALMGLRVGKREIFDIAYKTVLDVQGKGSGFDVAAAVYGGTLSFVTGGKVIESVDASGLPLIVGYTGVKADTVTLIDRVKKTFENRQVELEGIYKEIGQLAVRATKAVKKHDWVAAGECMNRDQELLQALGVSSDLLDAMCTGALEAGAYGAKLSGAGGGDCMIALADATKTDAVRKAITEAGGQVLEVEPNAEGVRID